MAFPIGHCKPHIEVIGASGEAAQAVGSHIICMARPMLDIGRYCAALVIALAALLPLGAAGDPQWFPETPIAELQIQIDSAYAEAFGRSPNPAELEGWTNDLHRRPGRVEQRVLVHWMMNWLRSPDGASEQRQVITRSYRETYHRNPSESEINHWVRETYNKRPGTDTTEEDDDEAHTYWRLIAYHRDEIARHPNGVVSAGLDASPRPCRAGFVWREATASDYVCIPPERRAETALENAQAAARRGSGDGCRQGFVWRESSADDHICVPPEIRSEVVQENRLHGQRAAPSR